MEIPLSHCDLFSLTNPRVKRQMLHGQEFKYIYLNEKLQCTVLNVISKEEMFQFNILMNLKGEEKHKPKAIKKGNDEDMCRKTIREDP